MMLIKYCPVCGNDDIYQTDETCDLLYGIYHCMSCHNDLTIGYLPDNMEDNDNED